MSQADADVFVGITAWNSELLLPLCLHALRATAPAARIVVLDNASTDATPAIVREHGAELVVAPSTQPVAMNMLCRRSDRPLTLLIHADVVMLSPEWPRLMRAALQGPCALVSPEDIGCGPYTRPWGRGMPESSFLCFRTAELERLRVRHWRRRWRVPYFRREVDFFGDHITYNLPARLQAAGLRWRPMQVHVSDRLDAPYFTAKVPLQHWHPELGHLRYGLGNFYSLDGVVTHYHNWYDRKTAATQSFGEGETLELNGAGVPVAYLKAYTDRFIADCTHGRLQLPQPQEPPHG